MLTEVTLIRLRDQLTYLDTVFPKSSIEAWERRPGTGKWSARENLAHLGRYHEVFLDRVRQILREDQPHFMRYRAEDDEQWPLWSSFGMPVLQKRIPELRAEVTAIVSILADAQLGRTGYHPALGQMTIVQWLEFFLLHEAHHLYTILFRLREGT